MRGLLERADRRLAAALLALSAATHLPFFGHPAEVVFDEVHYGRDLVHYLRGHYFFDQHPPLAKLLFAGAAALSGFPSDFEFRAIGQAYPDGAYLWIRALPTAFGLALAPLLFLLLRTLGVGRPAASVASALLSLDNGFVGTARFILPESMLVGFGLAAILAAARGLPAFAIGLLLGASVSIKWTALPFFAVAGLWIWRAPRLLPRRLRDLFVALVGVPAVLYGAVFLVHLARLRGPGEDLRFHGSWFRAYREEPSMREGFYDLARFPREVAEVHRLFARAATDPIPWPASASRFWEWPLGKKPIPAWGNPSRRIYVAGNLAAWSLGALAIAAAAVAFSTRRDRTPGTAALAGWALSLAPFVLMPRPTFLYSYLPAQVFALLAFGLALDRLGGRARRIGAVLAGSTGAATFLALAPTTYGLSFPSWLGPIFEFLSR